MSVEARHSGLDLFKARSPAASSDGNGGRVPPYSADQLRQMLRDRTAIEIGGKIAAVGCRADLTHWITQAKAAFGRGTGQDSRRLRVFITQRATALGLADLVPASWGTQRPDAAAGNAAAGTTKSAAWDIQEHGNAPPVRVHVPVLAGLASDSGDVLAKAAERGQLAALAREIGVVEKARAASAADLPGQARRWEQLAASSPDPATAAGYRRRAREARDQLAPAGEHLSKAARYAAKAAQASRPEERLGYEALAKAERARAGAA